MQHGASELRRVITFGTYDLFHVGHLRLLERARALGDHLSVGVSTDSLNFSKKNQVPVYDQQSRAEIVAALRCVDEVFFEESLEEKRAYLLRWKADLLVMGNDWAGKFDEFRDVCEVAYLPRTPDVSSSATKLRLMDGLKALPAADFRQSKHPDHY